MSLDVIGVGMGRTGTLSLRTALEQLGYPCYHMMSLMFDRDRRSDVEFWLEVAKDPDRSDRDWEKVFSGLRATVDYPACAAWRGLADAYPDAKLVYTSHPRGPSAWYDSSFSTIFQGTGLESRSEFGRKLNGMMDELVWHGMLEDTMGDRERAIGRHEKHLEEVRDSISPERLLIYSVDQGWEPLCAFLEVPVPAQAFPRVNDREEMQRMLARLDRIKKMRAAR